MMEFTGERYLPELDWPQLSYEHWHRYLWARQFAAGRRVLDLACGEGYGSAYLAQVASAVVGVDIDAETVAHAAERYHLPNLRFLQGPAEAIPLPDDELFDLVVSFETIEHLDEAGQHAFLAELRRLLRPNGMLLVSTPNRLVYSDQPNYRNEYHRKELYQEEFVALLAGHFASVQLLAQRIFSTSYVWPLSQASGRFEEHQLVYSPSGFVPLDADRKPALYLLAVCAAEPLALDHSLLLDLDDRLYRQPEAAAAHARNARDAAERQLELMTADRNRAINVIEGLEQHVHEKNIGLDRLAADLQQVLNERDTLLALLHETERQLQDRDEQLAVLGAQGDAIAEELARVAAANTLLTAELAWAGIELNRRRTELAEVSAHLSRGHQWARVGLAEQIDRVSVRLEKARARLGGEGMSPTDQFRRVVRYARANIGRFRRAGLRALRRGALPPPLGSTSDTILGALDEPTESRSAWLGLRVRGWAFSLRGAITTVEATLDGKILGSVRYGDIRTDVQLVYPQCPTTACGFDQTFTLPVSAKGRRRLTIVIRDEHGEQLVIERRINLSTMLLHLDAPQPDAFASGKLNFGGWVVSATAPIKQVTVIREGADPTSLMTHIPRPDVQQLYAFPHALESGFWGTVSFVGAQPGTQQVRVRAENTSGESAELELSVRVAPGGAPVAETDFVSWRDGLLEVTGWAVWPGSLPPRRTSVLLDGKLVGETRVHLSRPDIGALFPGNDDALQSGFSLRAPFSPEPGQDNRHCELRVELCDAESRRISRSVYVRHTLSGGAMNELMARIATLIEDYERRTGTTPAVLDAHTGLDAGRYLGRLTVFSPPRSESTLPYLDGSVDVTLVQGWQTKLRAEARRVTGGLVIVVDPGGKEELVAEWIADQAHNRRAFPSVSIIIPVFNQLAYTEVCLRALEATLPAGLDVEVLVVDDASTDATAEVILGWEQRDSRVRLLQNSTNSGFIASCNHGAREARGEVLVFLNNDTEPQPGWLEALLRVLQEHANAGAVGGKLIYKDGTLQEAGGVIFRDGSGWNFGKHDHQVNTPLYNFVREVDYCSGALLATPRALFWEIGGFDTRYAPAYYEDTDYCFSVRARGLRVYYQPESVVVHFEGISSGTDLNSGVKRHQVVNRATFVEKWREVLKGHPQPPPGADPATMVALAIRQPYTEQRDDA